MLRIERAQAMLDEPMAASAVEHRAGQDDVRAWFGEREPQRGWGAAG